MPSPRSPSMPTPRQIKEAFKAACDLCPSARIKVIGPGGVEFEYPDKPSSSDKWKDKPFSGDAS
ncbi:hypothetical protein [Kiloniella sp.]|uniref:hypothetical protein n=1 Tax=Kiloniella sp. TaxID=1938587 RepID=UPI003A90EDFD